MRVEEIGTEGEEPVIHLEVAEEEPKEAKEERCACGLSCEEHGSTRTKVVVLDGKKRGRRERGPRDPSKSRRMRGHASPERLARARERRRRRPRGLPMAPEGELFGPESPREEEVLPDEGVQEEVPEGPEVEEGTRDSLVEVRRGPQNWMNLFYFGHW